MRPHVVIAALLLVSGCAAPRDAGYVTIRRRGESGWEVILDTGLPDPPAQGGGAE